jgi:hypothetical protein
MKIEQGSITLPDAPGIGADVSPEALTALEKVTLQHDR